MTEEIKFCKVIFLVEIGVGKTSSIIQFIEKTFQEDQNCTIGGAFVTKSVIYDNSKTLKFDIWDSAGRERNRSFSKMYYKDIDVAILIYDITLKKSFEELQNYWVEQIKENVKNNFSILFWLL